MNCDLKHYIDVIHPHPVEESATKHIIREILKGLDYIHQNNIIHRDMKPQNVLVNFDKEKLEIRITDFGLSKYCAIIQKPNTKNLSK
jgi:serine/threonine protein kinase